MIVSVAISFGSFAILTSLSYQSYRLRLQMSFIYTIYKRLKGSGILDVLVAAGVISDRSIKPFVGNTSSLEFVVFSCSMRL